MTRLEIEFFLMILNCADASSVSSILKKGD